MRLVAAFVLAGCGSRDEARDAGPRDAGAPPLQLPAGEWRLELDRPGRSGAPAFSAVVGAGRGSYRWDGRALVKGMDERHEGTFEPSAGDLAGVWRAVETARFFETRDGSRDVPGGCESISYRGPDRATARCVEASPDAERLRRVAQAVETVVRRHAPDFDRPTPVPQKVDRCETDADCVVEPPVVRCCEACPAAMSRAMRDWHVRLRSRCGGTRPCPALECARPRGAMCDPYSKVCVAR